MVLPVMGGFMPMVPMAAIGKGRRGDCEPGSHACCDEDQFLEHGNLLVKVSLLDAPPP
jgi:hypothetical protein